MATILTSTAKLPVTYQNALANRYSPAKLAELAATGTKPLFFYGSLMFPSVIAWVVGNKQLAPQLASQMIPATLYAHERYAVCHADFSALVPVAANDCSTLVRKVEGMLAFALTAEQRYALDRYEYGLYNVTEIEVEAEAVESSEVDGVPVEKKVTIKVAAEAYIWDGQRDELFETSVKGWNVEEFLSGESAKRMLLLFIPCNPPSLTIRLISRTEGTDRIVDEMYLSFKHTQRIPWILPGVDPTNKDVEVMLVSVVCIRGGKLCHEHIYWDQASVLVQVGLLDPGLVPKGVGAKRLPVVGREAARKVLDEESVKSNELIEEWWKVKAEKEEKDV